MCKWLTDWRNDPATSWLADGPCPAQQRVLRNLHAAYIRFFEKAGDLPRFRARGQEPGVRYTEARQLQLDQVNGRFKAMKLGWMRARISQPINNVVSNATLKRDGDKWFCSIQVEIPVVLPAAGIAPSLGIDLGVKIFAAGSDGSRIAPLMCAAEKERRIKRYQRAVARKQKGSKNRRKAVRRLSLLHARTARQRADWLHKTSSALADAHAVIVMEALRIDDMSRSAKGTVASPGKNVRAKAALNRAIKRAGWGEFRRQLDYKLSWRGGQLILVDPAYTSMRCGQCGNVEKGNRRSQAEFSCMSCGHSNNADVNAAINILTAGHAVWAELAASPAACGEDVSRKSAAKQGCAASVKQEPTEEEIRMEVRASSVGARAVMPGGCQFKVEITDPPSAVV